jgi:hypothetical protein
MLTWLLRRDPGALLLVVLLVALALLASIASGPPRSPEPYEPPPPCRLVPGRPGRGAMRDASAPRPATTPAASTGAGGWERGRDRPQAASQAP